MRDSGLAKNGECWSAGVSLWPDRDKEENVVAMPARLKAGAAAWMLGVG